jgi:predicted RNA-binding Zn-ribbon protein involved in translation (DUF1610 family)
MTSTITCRACGQTNDLESPQAAQARSCSACGKPLSVTPPAAATLKFACPSCGRNFATKPELAGKKVRCSGCGASVRVPDGEPAGTASESSRPALKSFGGDSSSTARKTAERTTASDAAPDDSSLLDDLAALEGKSRRSRAEAILPSRSEAMAQVREKVAEEEAEKAVKAAEKARKKKKVKKKGSGFFDPKETLRLVGWVSVGIGLLAFLAWGYPDFRFPLGGLMCVVGFIVYLMGWASLKQYAAEQGPIAAILFRFFPPYQWYFVLKNWADTKDFVAFFGAGFLILSIGGVVIKSSPVGKMAAESEKAYQKVRSGARDEPPPVMPVPQKEEE